jgi:hypothetical protein
MRNIKFTLNKIIALGIVILLVATGVVVVFLFYDVDDALIEDIKPAVQRPKHYADMLTMTWEEMQRMDLPSDFPVDDRINPHLDEQAVFCEIVRIRARGIEELVRKIGLQWRTPPTFYYVVELHDAQQSSKEFSTWDTEFIRQEVFRRVTDGQETADVIIRVFQQQKLGLLGLRSQFVEKETISLEYCFRTGRWTGDNYFGHPDGYGRYLGEHFEVWFRLRQSHRDGDGIPCWVENNLLMTNSSIHDSHIDHDNDGIPTYWEWWWGFDPFTPMNHSELDISMDGLSNIDKYNLRQWHADPYQPEIYIEVDFMKGRPGGPDNVMWEESKQMIIDKFSMRSYHYTPWASKITVQIDTGNMGGGGELLPHIRGVIGMSSGIIAEFYKNNFADDRKGVFRYLVMADGSGDGPGGWNQPQDHKGWYDVMYVGTSRLALLNINRGFNVRPQLQRLVQAIMVMHELGHTLGMSPSEHAGIDNVSREAITYWKNYRSCMNYHMMYRPLFMRFFGKNYGLVLDYSDGSRDEPNFPDRNDWGMIYIGHFKTPQYRGGIDSWRDPE